jgi:hypothetical protein
MTEGDRVAANGWHPCRWVETPKSAGDLASHPYGCGKLAGETSGRRLHATAGKGVSVNACADQMLDNNERLNSLAGCDMRNVTTADSDETTLNGARQLQAAIDARVWRAAADRPTDGRWSEEAAADNRTMPISLITGMAPASSFIAITSLRVG